MGLRLLILLCVFSFSLKAAEVDQFSFRFSTEVQSLTNSIEKINLKTHQVLKEIVQKENQNDTSCDQGSFMKSAFREFRNPTDGGRLHNYILQDLSKDHYFDIDIEDSIFGDLSFLESPVLGRLSCPFPSTRLCRIWNKKFSKRLFQLGGDTGFGRVININGHLLSTDKIGHFLGTGFEYFYHRYVAKRSLEKVLSLGFQDEHFILGSYSTGVISYGDMAAEFNGMRFWYHLLNDGKDDLGEEWGPIVICKNDQWLINKKIDWTNFIDDSFDEAINCSNYRSEELLNKMGKKVRDLGFEEGCKGFVLEKKEFLLSKYYGLGHLRDFILNVEGNDIADENNYSYSKRLRLSMEYINYYLSNARSNLFFR